MTLYRVPVRATRDHPGFALVNPENVYYIGQPENEQDGVCIDLGTDRSEPGFRRPARVWTRAPLEELLAHLGPFQQVEVARLPENRPWEVLFLRQAAIVKVEPIAANSRARVTMRDGRTIDVADIAVFDVCEILPARVERS